MAIFDLPLTELQRRRSMKWRRYPADVLPAWVAEMDCLPAPAVRETLLQAVESGDLGYPEGEEYQQAFADYAAERWGLHFAPRDAVIVPDVMQGVARVLEVVTSPGAKVVVTSPVYNCFFGYVPWADRQVSQVPLNAVDRIDFELLAKAFAGGPDGKPEAFLLCNPHNPTGTEFTRQELLQVAELAAEHDVVVISDEIHAPLQPRGSGFVPYLSLPGTENAVTITSASKAWNLAGLKAAIAIGGSSSADQLRTLPDEVTHSASHLGILSHAAALTGGREWLDEVITELQTNRLLLAELLESKLGLTYRPAAATYLAWVDCSALGLQRPAAHFLQHGKVALSPGPIFGNGGDQHVRINVATSPQILAEVVDRMERALD